MTLKYPPYFDMEYCPQGIAENAYSKMDEWFQLEEEYCLAFNEWLFGKAQDTFFEQLGLLNLRALAWYTVIRKLFGELDEDGWTYDPIEPDIIEVLGKRKTKVNGFQVGEVTIEGDTVLDALAAFDLEIGKPFELKDIIIDTEDETIGLVGTRWI